MSAETTVVALCRAGFEPEAGEDLRAAAARAGGAIAIVAKTPAGFVAGHTRLAPDAIDRALASEPPIFVRSAFVGAEPVSLSASTGTPRGGPRADRLTPMVAAIDALAGRPFHAPPWRSAWIEYPDTNEGKAMSTLARALGARLDGLLEQRGAVDARGRRRLHVLLPDGTTAWIGTSSAAHGSLWPLGIPRLHLPRGAPSRSTLKLAEAIQTFLGDEAGVLLRPGLRAVDLGAAPGGWTWQLAQRGLKVVAVDNGALKGSVATDPNVTHVRADGLTFRVKKPVDWVVCDIVLQPIRIAELVAQWIGRGDARRAVFNLKLPMKKRYEEVRRCEARIHEVLERAGMASRLALRQLYHDREEVTGYLERIE